MDSILAFATERVSRRTYQKLLGKVDDAAAVKALNTQVSSIPPIYTFIPLKSLQLTHAFHIFEVGPLR